MNKKIRSLLVLGGVAAMFPLTASAVSNKQFSGNVCIAAHGGQESRLQHWSNYLEQTNAAQTDIICPVLRNNTTNQNGIKFYSVYVYNPSNAVTTGCQLRDYTTTGASGWFSSWKTFSGTGMWSFDLSDMTGSTYGAYSLYCSLPQGARITLLDETEY
jgi:hypothetical protein